MCTGAVSLLLACFARLIVLEGCVHVRCPQRVYKLWCAAATAMCHLSWTCAAGSVKYIWPIQQPIGDFDAQRKRMEVIRAALGWRVIGCDLLECYQ